jgi:acetylornithine deacetylase/succinyl-diaminopimelate desuccinylase-like protein
MLSQMLNDYAEANDAGKQDMFEEAAERMVTAEKAVVELKHRLEKSTDRANLYAHVAAEAVSACHAALDWLNSFGEHAPIEFGGEQELHDTLHAAIAKAKGENVPA